MNDINKLFFKLIQVSIGVRESLNKMPTSDDWGKLYDMAAKQSLTGICFAGLKRMGANADDGFLSVGMNEMQYLIWLGMAAKIQQRNEVLNRHCVELHEKLSADKFSSCILKGQGIAQLYGENLSSLRISGDIDVLMWKDGLDLKDNKETVLSYAKRIDGNAHASEHHIGVDFFSDTEVEMHYMSSYLCNPFANKRMQEWLFSYDKKRFIKTKNGLITPDSMYNIVFMLSHIFRHYMGEGVGMRQLMDYYFVLHSSGLNEMPLPLPINSKNNDSINILALLESFNMLKFAGAVMFVLGEVFCLDRKYMICKPNESLGRKLLDHIMKGGNFGHHKEEAIANQDTHAGRFVNQLVNDLKLSVDYPSEALWAPIIKIREFSRAHH